MIIALIAGVIGGLIGAGVRNSPPAGAAAAGGCDVTRVAATAFPALVAVNVGGNASGSGSVIDKEGDILTNDHVLPQPGSPQAQITVNLARGARRGRNFEVQVVGRDPATDIAVIRVRGYQGSLQPIGEGDSGNLVIGQPAVTLGNPRGLEESVSSGIVSALSRFTSIGPHLYLDSIQTDAAINPGNSGGPLTNCSGQQIGVNSWGRTDATLLGFAIPMDFALSIAHELIKDGHATHPFIAVLGITVTEEMARSAGLPRGALVYQVIPQSGAAQAGLQAGDVITDIGDKRVNSFDAMLVAVRAYRAGQTVRVRYDRNGDARSAQVKVDDMLSL